jgi:hypothetical protein
MERRGRAPVFLRVLHWLFFAHPLAGWLRRRVAQALKPAVEPDVTSP